MLSNIKNNNIIFHILYFLFITIASLSLIEDTKSYKKNILLLIILILFVYNFENDGLKNILKNNMTFIKIISVFIPLLLYVYFENINDYLYEKLKIKINPIVFTFILAINIIEPALIIELPIFFNNPNFNNIKHLLLGFCLILLALLTPKIKKINLENYSFIGFDNTINNKAWSILFTIILSIVYIFNPFFDNKNTIWWIGGLYSNFIPTIISILFNNFTYWFPLRLYSFVIVTLINNYFNNFQKLLIL